MRHYLTTDDREALAEYRHDAYSRVAAVHPKARGQSSADTDVPSTWDTVADTIEKSWNVRVCRECKGNAMVLCAGILLPCSECYGMGHSGQPIHARHIGVAERLHYTRDGDKLTEQYRAETVNGRTVIFRQKDLDRLSRVRQNGGRKPGRPRKQKIVAIVPVDNAEFYADTSAIVVNQKIES